MRQIAFTEDDIGLDYRWTQASGPTLLPQPVLSEAFTLTVREDLLSADANRGEVVLIMEIIEKVASNELASVNVTLAITKTNEDGVIKIDPINQLRLSASEINDPDGGPLISISYQWQQQDGAVWSDIADANQAIYRHIPGSNQNLRLVTTYTDGQGYVNSVINIAPSFENFGSREIAFIEQLDAIRNGLDGNYELVRDLDFNDPKSYRSDVVNQAWISGAGWPPISGFHGNFNGNGFTISNLRIVSEETHVGLFGNIPRTVFRSGTNVAVAVEIIGVRLARVDITGTGNVGALVGSFDSFGRSEHFGARRFFPSKFTDNYVISGSVTGTGNVGALVGRFNGSDIINSHVINGSVSTSDNNSDNGGCLVGHSLRGSITDSSANCVIEGNGAVGGLVGLVGEDASAIQNSFASGKVTGKSDRGVGGLVGISEANISNSHATGEVINNSTNTGGLVGISNASINDSYATGNVNGSDKVGGLVGNAKSTINNSFALGNVSANNEVGGLVGVSNENISNSHATGKVTGSGSSIGGLVGLGESGASVSNSFARGNVTGGSNSNQAAGGLIGTFNGTSISDSYATGNVTARAFGGLVGMLNGSIGDIKISQQPMQSAEWALLILRED